jgi:hypothetical protein
MLADWDDKSAFALCTFAYSSGIKDDPIILFRGKTPVSIHECVIYLYILLYTKSCLPVEPKKGN